MSRNYSSVAEPKVLAANVTTTTQATITLNNLTGLPAPPYVLVINPDTASEEVVLVTSTATAPTLNVTRAIETSGGLGLAQTHTAGNTVKHMIVGSDLQLVHNHLDNTTTAHGATGAVVGTTNTQTLTGKTINSASNTLTVAQASVTNLTSDLALKAPLASPTFTGTVTLPTGAVTSTMILDGTILNADINASAAIDWTKLGISSTVSSTEIGYVDGVTSAIQTQLNALTAAISVSVPAGVIVPYAGSNVAIPTGYFLCDGQAISRTTYATLFGVVGVTYGAGDTTTTFNVPNLKGRVPVGLDSTQVEFDGLGETAGAKTHTLITAEIPVHNHSGQIVFGIGAAIGTTGVDATTIGNSQPPTGSAGSDGAHNNLQPYIVVNYIIKY